MATPAKYLLIFNAVACVLVTVYKFTSKHISPLYFLHALSHYGFLLSYIVIVNYQDNQMIRRAGQATLKKLKFMHGVYAFVIFFGFFALSKCTENDPYPWAFVLDDGAFFFTYFICA